MIKDIDVKSTCEKIVEICEDSKYEYKIIRRDLHNLIFKLQRYDLKKIEELHYILQSHNQLWSIKNTKARYAENELARMVLVRLPYSLHNQYDKPVAETEVLEDSYDSDAELMIRLSSELLKYSKKVLSSKPDKSKRYKNRIKEGLRLVNDLQLIYRIRDIKDIFFSKLTVDDEDVQFFALQGLEVYFAGDNNDVLSKYEEELIEGIIDSTKSRYVASSSCQVLINTGKIDEFEAINIMDDWKEKNWN
ncbi:MAG: hypothetical protein RIC19_12550 [Phaeodactylibacter sp.]|uniref:hypothetical protein n=1 Tax=Phaeodactylibacter sp. TaxID=1940289 RepID=UPI0032EF0391